ncbi:MAG: AMP-binding protein [Rickettsiales bacterium]|nr:AMP-binding protein [Rickettsiales bacterium]
MKDFHNLGELVFYIAGNYDNREFLKFKKDGKEIIYSSKEFVELVCFFAVGLKKMGIQKQARLVNYSYQNPIWLIVDLGTILAGGVSVPIFDNISHEHLGYELEHSDAEFIFLDDKKNEEAFLGQVKKRKLHHIRRVGFDEVIQLGQEAIVEFHVKDMLEEIRESDLATIIYTSGSTGNPKGVMLSHKNLVSQIKDTTKCFDIQSDKDVALSFLPMAHIFERMVTLFYLSRGISINFVDDIEKLGVYLKEVRPTIMTTVPRMLEKVFAKINVGIESGSILKKVLGTAALKRALKKDVNKGKGLLDVIFDVLVYRKFRIALGGRIDMLVCGGASLSSDLERFYRNIGVNLLCGYGLTEASPVLSVNSKADYKFATVGKKFDSVELKISDEGELLAKGKNIMIGYLKNEAQTRKVVKDGWLSTGDLVNIDDEGYVKIIGRKKELFKTSYGKYVGPVSIEQKIMQALGFSLGVIVIAEGRKFVSALIFPDFTNLDFVKKKLNVTLDDKNFLHSKELEKYVNNKIDAVNKRLDNWEQIKKFKIIDKIISIDSGEITPSMKLKRNIIEEKFSKEIEEFYK